LVYFGRSRDYEVLLAGELLNFAECGIKFDWKDIDYNIGRLMYHIKLETQDKITREVKTQRWQH